MSGPLFDPETRARRRDRAFRQGPALFAHQRAFEDILERLSEVRRRFDRALLIGVPDPAWPERLGAFANIVEAVDPGANFARQAAATHADERTLAFAPGQFDLVVALGTLDTIDELPAMLRTIATWLAPDGLLIGAIPGGNTLPQLRAAMRAADMASVAASAHVHPRIEAAALGHLLTAAGFVMPVVDIDRMRVAYRSLGRLVGDLRAMAATNVLAARARPLGKAALAAAEASFAAAATDGRTVETFELVHFAGWTPNQG